MKVTKYYCDICGVEYEEHEHETLSLSGHPSLDSNESMKIDYSLCRKCSSRVFIYLCSLKEPKERGLGLGYTQTGRARIRNGA